MVKEFWKPSDSRVPCGLEAHVHVKRPISDRMKSCVCWWRKDVRMRKLSNCGAGEDLEDLEDR